MNTFNQSPQNYHHHYQSPQVYHNQSHGFDMYNNTNTENYSQAPSVSPSMLNSVEFWTSFVQKYEEYTKCLKSLSSEMMNKASGSESGSSSPAPSITNTTFNSSSSSCEHVCTSCNHNAYPKQINETPTFRVPFDDSFTTNTNEMVTFKDRQKRFNRFVKKRFIDEFGPIEYLSYKMLKRHESSMMDLIKHEARERYLPNDVTETEFKIFWKSALNTIRQTRYRYRSRQQGRF